jgi:hypothetical protein
VPMYCIDAANSFAICSLRAAANDLFFAMRRNYYSAQRNPISLGTASIGLVGIPEGTAGSL